MKRRNRLEPASWVTWMGDRLKAVALLASLMLVPFQAVAAEKWSDAGSPSIMREVDRYKAASRTEERAEAAAKLEQLGQVQPEAWNQLGILYRSSVPSDLQSAERMFDKAATAKNLNGLMNLIAVRVTAGRIAESCKAAEMGSAWPAGAGAPAMGYLGECYRLGRNGPKNVEKAEPILMEACRWGWEPACDSAMTSLRSNPTPARKKAYRAYLEKLSGAGYPAAMSTLGRDLAQSENDAVRTRGEALLEKASDAWDGPACTAQALVLWGKGDPASVSKIYDLLDCGIADKRGDELAWAFKGVIAGLSGSEMLARSSIDRASEEGLKQAAAFAAAFGYPVPPGADKSKCAPFCDWIGVIKGARRIQLLEIDEQNRQAEIERVAQEIADQEAAQLAAEEAAQQAEYQAQVDAINAQVAAQNAEARKERRRRFWGGVLMVTLALATGYVQAQTDALANSPPPRPVYQPPAISAPARRTYQPPSFGGVEATAGQVRICYVQTTRGPHAITVRASQACPVSLESAGATTKRRGTGFLIRESASGLNRICIYDGAAGESAVTISAAGICPLSQ